MARAARRAPGPAGPAGAGRDALAGAADPRRRRLPGPGRGGRDAQPLPPARLPHRRHDPHHRQQPARLHRHALGRALDPLRQRPGQGLRDPDRPRQRRRPRGLPGGRAAGARLPGALPQGLPDRPDRLPALGPQRGRRAVVHPAGDVRQDRRAPDGARAVGGRAGAPGGGHRGGGGGDPGPLHRRAAGGAGRGAGRQRERAARGARARGRARRRPANGATPGARAPSAAPWHARRRPGRPGAP